METVDASRTDIRKAGNQAKSGGGASHGIESLDCFGESNEGFVQAGYHT